MTVGTEAAIAASDARAIEPALLPDELHFTTDSRAIVAGDAFIALRGDRFDGHAFVRQAIDRGARVVVVSDAGVVPAGVAALVVANTTQAYLDFAGVARSRFQARVAAITGSAGKTTTKTLLAHILFHATHANVVATFGNENNEIGVAKLLLAASPDAAYVVVELGARRFGEIVPLARAARPDVAILTNVGEAHLEIMGSLQRLADTKWGIFSTGGHAVLNAHDAVSRERAHRLKDGITWFGTERDDLRLGAGERFVSIARTSDPETPDALLVETHSGNVASFATAISVPGEHNRINVAAASAGALALGIEPGAIADALRHLRLPPGRYERIEAGGIAMIFDAYNASMSGMLATLASFAAENTARRIAVLASMAELGDAAPEMHERVGAAAARSNIDALLVGGDYAPDLLRGAKSVGFEPERIVPFATNAVAVAWLRANAREGDLVLLKGSRRYRLEEIVEGLSA